MLHPQRTQMGLAHGQFRHNPCDDIIFPALIDPIDRVPECYSAASGDGAVAAGTAGPSSISPSAPCASSSWSS